MIKSNNFEQYINIHWFAMGFPMFSHRHGFPVSFPLRQTNGSPLVRCREASTKAALVTRLRRAATEGAQSCFAPRSLKIYDSFWMLLIVYESLWYIDICIYIICIVYDRLWEFEWDMISYHYHELSFTIIYYYNGDVYMIIIIIHQAAETFRTLDTTQASQATQASTVLPGFSAWDRWSTRPGGLL